MDVIHTKREIPDRGIDKMLDSIYNRKGAQPEWQYRENAFEFEQFTNHMLHDEPDENDPQTFVNEAHDDTITELKEQLLEAINKRKGKVLNIAL